MFPSEFWRKFCVPASCVVTKKFYVILISSHLFAPYCLFSSLDFSFYHRILKFHDYILWGESFLLYWVGNRRIFQSLCPCPTVLIYIFSMFPPPSCLCFFWTSLDSGCTSLNYLPLIDIFSTFSFVCIFLISKIFIILLPALSVYLLCSRMSSEEMDFAVCRDWGKDRGRHLRG